MPSAIDNDRASRPAARCGNCKQEKPRAAFFPSVFWRYDEPLCRECQRDRDNRKRMEGHRSIVEKLRGAFSERATWTAIEAADVVGYKRHSVGALLETLRAQGFIERIATGVYRFPASDTPPAPPVMPTPPPPVAFTAPAAPSVAAPPPQSNTGLFVQAGPYLFGTSNIACVEYDDRGRASVMLNVQEMRPGGHMAPVTFEFEGDDAARLLSQVSQLRGVPPVELVNQVARLGRERDELRAKLKQAELDRDAALSLAEEREQELNRIYSAIAPRRSAA